MLGPAGVRGDEGQVDLRLRYRRQFDLSLLGGLFESLKGHAVLAQVNALLLPEFIGDPFDDTLIEVIATQESVTVGGLHLEDTLANVEDGDVESAASQIIDGDLLVLPLVQTVSQRRCCGLVDDAQYLQSSNPTSILRRLALGVVKVGGDGDDGLSDRLA